MQGSSATAAPQPSTTRAAAMSWARLNSLFLGQVRAWPPSQTMTTLSRMEGSSSRAEATLVMAPMATTYRGRSGV